tara:strand:- start:1124 stop:1429 length:306 start_codon:yes stop_codon:yes gene_type:complete
MDERDDIIFEVQDPTNREIRLTKKQWSQITRKHPQVTSHYEDIIDTIKNPLKITPSYEETKYYYFKYLKHKTGSAKYLKVIVNYLNGEGFIITALFDRKIK